VKRDSAFIEREIARVLVYPGQRIAIATNLFLIAVTEKRLGRDQHTLYTRGFEGDALNSI
jgi:hypothetical protein